MRPEEVPDDLVEKAYRANPDRAWYGAPSKSELRIALAAVLPAHTQSVTSKYRRFVKTIREITKHGESMQDPGTGDQCVISPPELRQALRDLRDGRQ